MTSCCKDVSSEVCNNNEYICFLLNAQRYSVPAQQLLGSFRLRSQLLSPGLNWLSCLQLYRPVSECTVNPIAVSPSYIWSVGPNRVKCRKTSREYLRRISDDVQKTSKLSFLWCTSTASTQNYVTSTNAKREIVRMLASKTNNISRKNVPILHLFLSTSPLENSENKHHVDSWVLMCFSWSQGKLI